MKRALAFLFLVVVGTRGVLGSPFLVCDPVPGNLDPALEPVSYVINGLGSASVTTPATVNADGTVQLMYDLAGLANGPYTVTAAAVNANGGSSPNSLPFSFMSGVPAPPANLKITP